MHPMWSVRIEVPADSDLTQGRLRFENSGFFPENSVMY